MRTILFPVIMLTLRLMAGADQWVSQTSGTINNLYSVNFPHGDTGFVSGAGCTLLRTMNGGVNWIALNSGTTQSLYAVNNLDQFVDTAYVVGGNGTILKTTDRGATWTAQVSGTTQSLRFVVGGGSFAIAGGDSGTILMTLNGGATWSRASTGTASALYSIGTGKPHFIVVGANGALSMDTAGVWSVLSMNSPPPLYGVRMGGTTAYAVGGSGTILKTINSGTSWSPVNSGVTQQLNAIFFADSDKALSTLGFIAGAGGTILKTTNTGDTWTPLVSGTTQNLNAIAYPQNTGSAGNVAYTVGNGGLILKDDINATPVLRSAKDRGELVGVSASGKLWYHLPAASNVEALLFNTQGRLIWKASETRQSAGYHEMRLPAEFVSGANVLEFRADGIHKVVGLKEH